MKMRAKQADIKKVTSTAEQESIYPFREVDSFSCYPRETGECLKTFLLLGSLGNKLDL